MTTIKSLSLLAIGTLCVAAAGCATQEGTGTAIGAATGAGLGAIIGNNLGSGHAAEGALIGAAAGGLVGNVQGRQADRISRLEQDTYTRTVYVRNSNGSFTPVGLRSVGPDQWQGPRGEVYNGIPSQGQLGRTYGF